MENQYPSDHVCDTCGWCACLLADIGLTHAEAEAEATAK